MLIISLFLFAGCLTKKYSNQYDLPVEFMAYLAKAEGMQFLGVKKLHSEIMLKRYEFYSLEFEERGRKNTFTTAVSSQNNLIFLLNYPDIFAFNNYNTMIRNEKYEIPNKEKALDYLRFISKLFIPKTVHFNDIDTEVKDGHFPNETKLKMLKEDYKFNITFTENHYINADFYTLSTEKLMYNWKIRLNETGEVVACRITMIALNNDYKEDDKIVIYNKRIIVEAKKKQKKKQ